jgi:nitrate reductase cytochrome c-type subunit
MAAALDSQREADRHRSDAQEHTQAAAISMDKAVEKTREAANYLNQALRQFMIPTDILEN